MRLYDITHPLSSATAPWPGDPPFALEPTGRIAQGSVVNLTRMAGSPHLGTHADAPYHYDDQGLAMADVPLERYLGPARLVALEGRRSIAVADLEEVDLAGVERLLIRTGVGPDLHQFPSGFTWLEPEAIRYLGSRGVGLIGTDAPSVDPLESATLPAHRACAAADILILENLRLTAVPPGDYELLVLPLKIVGGDGSPIRAVLRES